VDISVIIAAHDAAETLPAQLQALGSQTTTDLEWELIVVDNLSVDDTAAVAESFADQIPGLRVLKATDAAGSGYARNVGAAVATGHALAFCDADDVVACDWVENMAMALSDHPLVAGTIDVGQLNPRWVVRSRGRLNDTEIPLYEGMFPMATGCNMGIDARLFKELSGFDNDYDRVEDAELSMRSWMVGHPARFAAGAVVHYRLRTDVPSLFRQSRGYGFHRPRLVHRAAEFGAQMPSLISRLGSWGSLLVKTPTLASRAGRASWVWALGLKVGTLEGARRAGWIYL